MSVTHIRGTLRAITWPPSPAQPIISWHTNLRSCTNPHAGILSDSCTAAPGGRGVITPSICSWLAPDVERRHRADPCPHEGAAKKRGTNKAEISIRGVEFCPLSRHFKGSQQLVKVKAQTRERRLHRSGSSEPKRTAWTTAVQNSKFWIRLNRSQPTEESSHPPSSQQRGNTASSSVSQEPRSYSTFRVGSKWIRTRTHCWRLYELWLFIWTFSIKHTLFGNLPYLTWWLHSPASSEKWVQFNQQRRKVKKNGHVQ